MQNYKCNPGEKPRGVCGGVHLHHAKYFNEIKHDVHC